MPRIFYLAPSLSLCLSLSASPSPYRFLSLTLSFRVGEKNSIRLLKGMLVRPSLYFYIVRLLIYHPSGGYIFSLVARNDVFLKKENRLTKSREFRGTLIWLVVLSIAVTDRCSTVGMEYYN